MLTLFKTMISTVKKMIIRIIPNSWYMLFVNLKKRTKNLFSQEKYLQYLLRLHYESIVNHNYQKDLLRNHELCIYSQNGEDGILLFIFSQIGTTNCRFVEIGIDDGTECNTANLSLNFGWQGLLIDQFNGYVIKAKSFYKKTLESKSSNIRIVQCFVTAENINKVLLDNSMKGEIDLLSIDIDGNDYWVWKAIDVLRPRVVVIEYNPSLGSEESIAIKYDPNFSWQKEYHEFYYGASLAALTKLARSKGYILVGCDSDGANAFFVQKDISCGELNERSVQEAYYPHSGRIRTESLSDQYEHVRNLDFTQV